MGAVSVVAVLMVVALAAVGAVYVTSTQANADQVSSQNQQLSTLQSQLQSLSSLVSGGHTGVNTSLPVMDQPPTVRTIRETWYLSPSAHQDRFNPSFIVVNQGDTVKLTMIDNDTVAHDFVVGPPYNIIVNATVPGLVNDLTGQTFTTPSRNNSPGVVVDGTPGNVTAYYSFVAVYSGIYEFVCTYHAEVGMIGYLVVLPNAAYTQTTTAASSTTTAAGAAVAVSIVQGATTPPNKGFAPDNITLVIGVNNTVTWTNNDSSIHTVTANDGSFSSGYLNPGGSFTYTFAKPGVYEYHCQIHPWMVGYVTVLAG
ncbi:MAG: cupredoxin domain-containing protein [Thaumarchaeota archaeon]|nr:cupredoxin domain-containing protein [Nitrososphaerota archaeon]